MGTIISIISKNTSAKGRLLQRLMVLSLLLPFGIPSQAQRFFNLTSDEVSVDSVLPEFTYTVPLDGDFNDSIYSSSILYPEFIDMTPTDIANYNKLSGLPLPTLPDIEQTILLDRKKGNLMVSFCPLVLRNGKYQILVSFMLRVDSRPKAQGSKLKARSPKFKAAGSGSRYASHSVLAQGSWAKIRVPSTGVYELTQDVIRQAGFSDLNKVHIYGYGGNLQNEVLNGDELQSLDDLKEVATCTVNGHRLFYAKGPVSWSSNTTTQRTRNPYSDYGYYFITENDATPTTADSATFVSSFYPSTDDYHTLYEHDGFSWYHGGRNLFDPTVINNDASQTVTIDNPSGSASGTLYVSVTAGTDASARIELNGTEIGTINVSIPSSDGYWIGYEAGRTFSVSNLQSSDTVTITALSGGPLHLDYVSLTTANPAPAPTLGSTLPAAEYVYNITNQDHHADGQADMVIIIPTSQKLLSQAQRLADFHRQHDSLRVTIVPADELYNEFASGTPDANAYRRYMKMLYDRAQTDDDIPKYLLLFGDGVWDNRLLTSDCRNFDADDLLLCYESENSFNEILCYVDDGFFCYLSDGSGTNYQHTLNVTSYSRGNITDALDVAVGRFPVTTEADAKIMVDKTINYVNNANAGAWENVAMFMGDDGNNNLHMTDANEAADIVGSEHPGLQIKKVMWDAYKEEATSTGNRYPDVTAAIKQQQQRGALIMDYVGHGRADWMSHEAVLTLNDFKSFTNRNLPLWITASCDIMAFDDIEENIGETAVLTENAGAVAFFGTTRTVYSTYNRYINNYFLQDVLSQQDGKITTIGEAARLSKNRLITSGRDRTSNKLQYSLLGDPAISLNLPQGNIVIDSINGNALTSSDTINIAASTVARIAGHVEGHSDFNGTVTLNVLDSRELVTCRGNSSAEIDGDPFTFYNRTKTIFSGTDSVADGKFSVTFAVPLDINYSNQSGLINSYAVNTAHTFAANGSCEQFKLVGTDSLSVDTIGPTVYCYLNNTDFRDGDNIAVNTTPYFYADISDPSGINATGNGIGHDMELTVDGKATMIYNLNDNFTYDFGSFTSGHTYYNIPVLEPGKHTLLFRVWDTRNNSTAKTLTFNVEKSQEPFIYDVNVTRNPATTSTTFIVTHNFGGSTLDVIIDVFDMSGRLLWTHYGRGTSETNGSYTVDWDLTQDTGSRLQTGVYLYRVRVASDGSSYASKAKKLVIINNN